MFTSLLSEVWMEIGNYCNNKKWQIWYFIVSACILQIHLCWSECSYIFKARHSRKGGFWLSYFEIEATCFKSSFLFVRKRGAHCCEKCLCPLSFFSNSLLKFSKYSPSSMIILKQCRLNGRYVTAELRSVDSWKYSYNGGRVCRSSVDLGAEKQNDKVY